MAPSSDNSAARSGLLLSVSQLWLTAAGYFVAIVLGRTLGPEPYGQYGIIYSTLVAIELVGRLGIPQALSRLIASSSGSASDLERAGIAGSLIVSLLLMGGLWLAAPHLALLFDIENGTKLFRIAALDIPIFGLYLACVHIVNGHRRFGEESAATIVYASARAVGIVLLLLAGVSIEGALIANVGASAVALAFVASRLPASSFFPSLSLIRRLVIAALPIAVFSAGSQIVSRVDLWALGIIGDTEGSEAVGHYVAASSLARLPNLAFFVLSSLLIPSIARALSQGRKADAATYMEGAMRFLVVCLVPVVALTVVNAADIMQFCFGVSYRQGDSLLQFLIAGNGLAYTVMMTLGAVLVAMDKANQSAWVTIGAIPVAVLANALLVPPAGALGAAIAAFVTNAAATIAAGVLISRALGRIVSPSLLARVLLAALPIAWAGRAIEWQGVLLVVELGALLALYLVVLWCLKVIRASDVSTMIGSRYPRGANQGNVLPSMDSSATTSSRK